jgi:hypothetical protein
MHWGSTTTRKLIVDCIHHRFTVMGKLSAVKADASHINKLGAGDLVWGSS